VGIHPFIFLSFERILSMKFRLIRKRLIASSLLIFSLTLAAFTTIPGKAAGTTPSDKMTAEEVVVKHLAAVGTPEARAARKSIVAVGKVVSTLKVGGSGTLDGSVVIASTGNRNLIGLDYGMPNYSSESMAYNGKDLTYGEIKPGFYAQIVQFMKRSDMPMREGLMGGALSTGWPLWDVAGGKVKLKYNGTKKIDGRECHVLRYEGKNSGGLVTSLFFDAETFRHVRTEYERRQSQAMPTAAGETQTQGESVTKLTENFSDFSAEGGLTLPHTYSMELSLESLNKRYLQNWVFSLSSFVFNKQMSDAEFVVGGNVPGKP
jgi:hypothetical protein